VRAHESGYLLASVRVVPCRVAASNDGGMHDGSGEEGHESRSGRLGRDDIIAAADGDL